MTQRGRRPVLDEAKKQQVCSILALGGSRRTAAWFVGCATSTITRAGQLDEAFRQAMIQAEAQAELFYLRYIQQGSEKNWRAAAWLLENRFPLEYGHAGRRGIPTKELDLVLRQFAELVAAEVPRLSTRRQIRMQLGRLIRQMRRPGALGERESK